MSGRTPSRLGAVVALVAAVAFAAGLAGPNTELQLLDFQWGAPAANHTAVETGSHATR